jgi:hypothetical protein
MQCSLFFARIEAQPQQFSVEALKGNVRSAISVLGTSKHHSWKLHVDDFFPHCIPNQLDSGMKGELDHDITEMRFGRFQLHAEHRGDFLGSSCPHQRAA